jgi:membrane protein YdbS with pleckstrin-like domain
MIQLGKLSTRELAVNMTEFASDSEQSVPKSVPPKSVPPKSVPPTIAERLRSLSPAADDDSDDDESESELWAGGYSGKAMYGTWVALATITIAGFLLMSMVEGLRASKAVWVAWLLGLGVLWIASLLVLAYRKLSVWYVLTTQRFKHRAGLLIRTSDRIELIDVDDVTYRQGPIQALLGVGTVTILSSDTSHPQLVLLGIQDVRKVADVIDDARRRERRKRGLHIEAV